MTFLVLIPARRASTRLPDKAMADIHGRPMVVRVAERALQSGASRVLVATDDADIAACCTQHGVASVMTRADHATGTDRLAEAADLLGLNDDDIVVNVQGDEPLIDPRLIAHAADALDQAPDCVMATACHPIRTSDELFNPNVVKTVADAHGRALYFSRAPIPWNRDAYADGARPAHVQAFRHIGLYAYRAGFLRVFPRLAMAPLEQSEALEQLRVLWHGHRIALFETDLAPGPGVDTAADLQRVRQLFFDAQ